MLKEKVHLLLKSLPQKLRRHCVPLPDYAAGFYERWFDHASDPETGLLETIIEDIQGQCGVRPARTDFKVETLPPHLYMNFKRSEEHKYELQSLMRNSYAVFGFEKKNTNSKS